MKAPTTEQSLSKVCEVVEYPSMSCICNVGFKNLATNFVCFIGFVCWFFFLILKHDFFFSKIETLQFSLLRSDRMLDFLLALYRIRIGKKKKSNQLSFFSSFESNSSLSS